MARKCSVERASKELGGFAAAKKQVVIQFQGRERSEQNLLDLVKSDILNNGMKEEDIQNIDVYIKVEEMQVYYVVNKEIHGQIAF